MVIYMKVILKMIKDKAEGKGIFYWNNGDLYESDFKDDKREGKAIVYYNNGNREMGDYLDDNKIGIHVKLNFNGEVIKHYY